MKVEKKVYKLEVSVDQYKKQEGRLQMTMDVEGCMEIIKGMMRTRDQRDLLDEYAKLYILKAVGVKLTPEEVDSVRRGSPEGISNLNSDGDIE